MGLEEKEDRRDKKADKPSGKKNKCNGVNQENYPANKKNLAKKERKKMQVEVPVKEGKLCSQGLSLRENLYPG